MNNINGFWHGAACLSGRLDLSVAFEQYGDRLPSLSPHELGRAGISTRHQKRLTQAPPLATQHGVVCLTDTLYPNQLRQLPYAPPVLFYSGNIGRLQGPSVAIVGARRCTQRGREIAQSMASELADNGLVIVSGMAYGIDDAAHGACRGRTIAVLGEGLDAATRGRKGKQIRAITDAGGLVLSEFPPNTHASRHTFPQRNRVIAGLTQATIVVEATMRSGSRITARQAVDAGKDVMAVPGHPLDPTSVGCNALIQEGAALVQNAQDVLRNMGFVPKDMPTKLPDAPDYPIILAALESPLSFDELVVHTQMGVPQLLTAIEALELTGWVQRLPGDRLRRRNTP